MKGTQIYLGEEIPKELIQILKLRDIIMKQKRKENKYFVSGKGQLYINKRRNEVESISTSKDSENKGRTYENMLSKLEIAEEKHKWKKKLKIRRKDTYLKEGIMFPL